LPFPAKTQILRADLSQLTVVLMKNNKEAFSNRFDLSKKNLINIDIDEHNGAFYRGPATPRSREEELAIELAITLQDKKGLPFYISCSNKYPEPFLRDVLRTVMSIPDHKIKRSRGALFNFLVNEGLSSSN
jgi:hypothetical protein